jgi:hypothetical protein
MLVPPQRMGTTPHRPPKIIRRKLWGYFFCGCCMDTDTRISEDIVAEYERSPVLRNCQLHLDVQAGIVTISGRVNSLSQRKAAERAAARVTGVKTVILQIGAAAIPLTVTDIAVKTQNQTCRASIDTIEGYPYQRTQMEST